MHTYTIHIHIRIQSIHIGAHTSIASDSGGAVYGRKSSHIAMLNSRFHENAALNSGGAIHAQRNSMVEINDACYFTHKLTADCGRAVRVYDLSTALQAFIRVHLRTIRHTFQE